MIFVTQPAAGGRPGRARTWTRADVWDGLVLKANNALPFVPSMTFCEVTRAATATPCSTAISWLFI